MPDSPLLSVRDLTRRFGGVIAVDHVAFDAREGEALGIIGPNGSGKSTLLKLICGEHAPDSGEIRFDGVRLDGIAPHRAAFAGVALAHQIPKPFRQLTVRQNVRVGALASAARRALAESEHVEEILSLTGLGARAESPAACLGLLDLKRLELARALSVSPRLLMLDEVGAGLVQAEIDSMIDLIRRIRASGTTLLIVEHVESVIRELAERVIVLDWGRIIKTGPPAGIAVDPEVRALYLGTDTDASPAQGEAARPPAAGGRAPVRAPGELLRLEAVSAGYGGARALHRVDLCIAAGEVVAVFGANGSGKTTLANAISGLVAPSEGRVIFDGVDIAGVPAHRRAELGIAHCHEGRRIFAGLSVRENLDLGAWPRRARAAARRGREQAWALFPVLRERERQIATTLSGGQQQMLAIARSLMSQPRLLILDEASLGLAPIVANQILKAVGDIRAAGISVLLVEQNVHRSLAVADRVCVLDRGVVSFQGSADELRGEATLWKVYFGSFAGEAANEPVREEHARVGR